MGEEIAFEYGRISDFRGLVTLTLTLDQVILHTIMHHSSTSTYIPNFTEIKATFLWTDGHFRLALLDQLVCRVGFEPTTCLLQVQRSTH